MKNPLYQIQTNKIAKSPKLALIADYILANTEQIQFMTITVLAQKTATSEATVLRFCRDIGYNGYSDFKMALALELNHLKFKSNSLGQRKDDIPNFATECAINSLKDTLSLIDREQIIRICNLIHHSKIIHCIGVAASSIVANYLCYRLIRIGKTALMHTDTHIAMMQSIHPNIDDLWFAISSSGSTREIIEVANSLKKNHKQIVAISNISNSPLGNISTEVLVAANPEGPLTGGALASKVGALLIVDILINEMIKIYPDYSCLANNTAEVTVDLLL
ncbi:MurR/RpiR family transcriptional regulator [Thorsellia anophelis]|uniref:Transcriptional regulator, RpiR family n=1 Tax=Thorsellia anophelis DSM 18579 TaxID=1123402 RepID=A0A1I0BPN6_9GAMM|nr:MurR/RpiR family transcriptional regulator [Thorsellia anophelis]SET08274.1 transcriptional regulator, RpiR family [Thorsellia anophelis DSM 18579]